jgi:hypothetical protein
VTDQETASPREDRPSLSRVYDATLPDIADHETRLRALERRAWTLAGVATIAGASLAQIVERVLAR